MKKYILITLSSLLTSFAFAQQPKHVKWSAEYKGNGREGEIIITAIIDKGWHSYSQKPTDGPIPTEFKFTPSNDYELVGTTSESESHEEFDKTFDAKVYSFSDKAVFRQKIKMKQKSSNIGITVDYMVCSDAMCIKEGPVQLSVNAQ